MPVVIENMELPMDCEHCRLSCYIYDEEGERLWCSYSCCDVIGWKGERPNFCPLQQVESSDGFVFNIVERR